MSTLRDDFPENLRQQDVRMDIWNNGVSNPCVRLTHLPTGLISECVTERMAFRARERALQDLSNKVAHVGS